MNSELMALLATAVDFVGVAFFKVAVARMRTLRGSRFGQLLGQLVRSPIWLLGLVILVPGLILQIKAELTLPVAIAQPLYVASILLLLAIAIGYFKEEISGREWAGLFLIGVATLLAVVSVTRLHLGHTDRIDTKVPSTIAMLAVTIPSILIPLALFWLGDRRPTGQHARPLTGVAYGISTGILVGTSELVCKGLINIYRAHELRDYSLITPYLLVFVIATIVFLGQQAMALQRARMSIVITISTIVGEAYLTLIGSLLYGATWPNGALLLITRVLGFALFAIAIFVFPRQDTRRRGDQTRHSHAVRSVRSEL